MASDRLRILVAEDDETTRLLMRSMLVSFGYETLEAGSGSEALAVYQEQHPEVVITDWMMPDLSGVEVCRRIRELEREAYTYLIVVTARNQKRDTVVALTAGADEFLRKPVCQAELRVRVATAERILNLQSALRARVWNLEEALGLLKESLGSLVETERLAAVGAVSLTVRHEVNNPLTGILGLTDLCLIDDATLPPRVRQNLEQIQGLAKRIADFVARLQGVKSLRVRAPLRGFGGLSLIDLEGEGDEMPPPKGGNGTDG